MGKRSDFDRIPRDFYPTPLAAVEPLRYHLPQRFTYAEPCAGDGRLVNHLTTIGGQCEHASDIEPQAEWIEKMDVFNVVNIQSKYIITNPPWDRKILHPLIEHLSNMVPTWLLFDADWMHTKQSKDFLPRLKKVVSIGRVKWIEDSKATGKDNCCWYLFDKTPMSQPIEFWGRK